VAELQLYSNALVKIVGVGVLCQEASVSVEKKSGLNPVFTTCEGLAGASQGATTCEVSVENAVPSTDFEFNPDPYMRSGTVVEIWVDMAGRRTVMKGFIMDASYSHSVNDASKMSFKMLCRFGDFE
jgi:hypothetical protein